MSETNKTTIVQLVDNDNNPISPYTPAAAVYYQYEDSGTTKWVNMESKLGSMDITRIEASQDDALSSIAEKKQWALDKIDEEGYSYREDIDTLSGMVITLDEKVFPLTINVTITTDLSNLNTNYTYTVTEYEEVITGSTISVEKWSNNGEALTLYSGNVASQTLTTTATFGRDRYKITCAKGAKESETWNTRYLCLYGVYTDTINANVLQNNLERKVTTGPAFNVTVTTTTENPYIWIAVPEYLSITKITSQGFDVTMNSYVNIEIGGINYRAYRTKNPLQGAQWNLTII